MPRKLTPLGEALQAAYKAKGLTRASFARLVGANYANVFSWETGTKRPSERSILRIAKVSGIPASEVSRLSGRSASKALQKAADDLDLDTMVNDSSVVVPKALLEYLASGEDSPVTSDEIEYLKSIRVPWELASSDYRQFLKQYRKTRSQALKLDTAT